MKKELAAVLLFEAHPYSDTTSKYLIQLNGYSAKYKNNFFKFEVFSQGDEG